MKGSFTYSPIPRSRMATFDMFSVGLLKHHVVALLEFDVTDSRRGLQELRKGGTTISFNAWLIKVISSVLQEHPEAAAYLYSKKKLLVFRDINTSIVVEKRAGNAKVPIPVVIEKTNEKSAMEITREIDAAKNMEISEKDMVLHKKTSSFERLYYHFPGFLRRFLWKIMLNKPRFAFRKMGNVVITSVGMMGKINGWFITKSVHPIAFGIGSILTKPWVVDKEIKIREVLNMTILIDHDVIDGSPMVRLLNELTKRIETGYIINQPEE